MLPRARPLLAAVLLLACGSEEAPPPLLQPQPAVRHPLSDSAYTMLQASWAPNLPSAETAAAIAGESLRVTELERMLEMGLGVTLAAGQPWIEHDELATSFTPGAPADRRSLLYVWQAADPQIIDEESPIRFEGFDALYRPHGHLTVQVFESHVRTAQRISELSGRPFDFALIAGDLTDGSQKNELRWMLDALNGGTLNPDSGAEDDPVPGPGNDFNDPLISDGLAVPWYAAIGNHETLYNGGFGLASDEIRSAAVGSEVYPFPLFTNGFRDGATPDAAVRTEGPTPADPERLVLRRDEVLSTLFEAEGEPVGHGLSSDNVQQERGYFAVTPMAGQPLRLLVLDTVNSAPTSIGVGSLGWMEQPQLDWLQDELAQADSEHELVVVTSHHRPDEFADNSPVPGTSVIAALAASPSVVLHVTGHGHRNEKALHPAMPTSDEHGYWELMLASTVDYPMHSRIIEMVDEGNGHLTIYCTNLDHNAPPDSLAHHGRQLASAKRAFPGITYDGDVGALWQADTAAQNLALRIAITPEQATRLQQNSFPTRIESEETLATLPEP